MNKYLCMIVTLLVFVVYLLEYFKCSSFPNSCSTFSLFFGPKQKEIFSKLHILRLISLTKAKRLILLP